MEDSASDSHDEQELLMSTRQRRSNAGNRMRKLLEQELEEMKSKTDALNDDELDLLFQEDADDEEFEGEGSSSEAEGSEEPERVFEPPKEPTTANDDMLLSDSEPESSEQEGDDAGERELQDERARQRKKRKKNLAPVIKKKSKISTDELDGQVRQQLHHELLNAESLLVADRRTSKRSSVVANKLEVYAKLSRAEKKRKVIQERIKKHKALQREVVLTQEDRMRIALETEKFNLLSLNKYKEQEVSKKQSRLAMQKRQKIKFRPGEVVIQELSIAWNVDPVMELEDKQYWDAQLKKREKKKKKYPRRQKKHNLEPLDKTEKDAVNNQQIDQGKNENMGKGLGDVAVAGTTENRSHVSFEETNMHTKADYGIEEMGQDTSKEGKNTMGVKKKEDSQEGEQSSKENITSDVIENKVCKDTSHNPTDSLNISKDNKEDELKDDCANKSKFTAGSVNGIEIPNFRDTSRVPEDTSGTRLADDNGKGIQLGTIEKEDGKIKKQVTFAEQTVTTHIDPDANPSLEGSFQNIEPTGVISDNAQQSDGLPLEESHEELIYEGPPQLVAKDMVSLYRFPSETYEGDVRDELFGKQWSNATRQRSPTVENICKITMPENALSYTANTSIIPDLSFLENFPAFGEYGRKIVHDTGGNKQEELEVEIKTQPPSGVLFSNGVRKRCLITNKECHYFDPKNGVPYSDVEAYRVIQEIQDSSIAESHENSEPHYQWVGFRNGGIYLDLLQKPANNVPEGF